MEELIKQFEEKIQKALLLKYANEESRVKEARINDNVLNRWNILEFYNIFIKNAIYPRDRIEKIVSYLFDIKIQLYYLIEVDLGVYNDLVFANGDSNGNIDGFPNIKLIKLSLDQNIISKSKVLWERIMNFIYYLETGEELEDKVSKNKSKKKIFFDFILSNRWKFLSGYQKYIEWFDEELRTPELHKSSTLRKHFLMDSDIDPNKLIGIVNIALNAIWENGLDIIQGKEPQRKYGSSVLE